MAIASAQQSFLTNTLSPVYTTKKKMLLKPLLQVSCRSPVEDKEQEPSRNEMRVAKAAIVALAAGVLTLGSVHEAVAAKTGGRVGGQAFRSAAPRPSSPRINNSRTNIYVNPRVAPPLFGGYGYGVPFYGGWGWSPFSFFAPGPSVAIGIGGGFEVFALLLFLSAVATVIRRFTGSRTDDEDDY